MADAGFALFTSLSNYVDLQELVDNGEAEGLHLECKAPASPKLNQDSKIHLAKAVSGFSNTAGGVIIWGISTTKHDHSGLDVLTQLEPIGRCRHFEQQVNKTIPTLATPAIFGAETKIIRERLTDTKGIVLAYISKLDGDPVQSNLDHLFCFRGGDDFPIAPYDMIKRLFAASESPNIYPLLVSHSVELRDDGFWEIPIAVTNHSTAIAEHVAVFIRIVGPDACESVLAEGCSDVSNLNPGQQVFEKKVQSVVHRGLDMRITTLKVKMKAGELPKRALVGHLSC